MNVDDVQNNHHLALADWRREISSLYSRIRQEQDPQLAWHDFRRTRDTLFRRHPQSPLDDEQRDTFRNLRYFPYLLDLRLSGSFTPISEPKTLSVDLPKEGLLRYTEIGTIQFGLSDNQVELTLYWIEGYGGGLFLPFRDASNGRDTFGGGRYLYDSIKGADLGAQSKTILLDFNFAYNPSCAYNDRWICPLAPSNNWLSLEIAAGEKSFSIL